MYRTTLSKSHEYLSYALFFALPLPDKFLPLAIVLWGVSWLLWRIFDGSDVSPLNKSVKVGLICFALWVVGSFVSVFFTHDSSGSLIERRLMFVIVPLVLLVGESSRIDKVNLIKALLLGAVFAVLVYSSVLLEQYLISNNDVLRFRLVPMSFHWYVRQNLKHPAYFTLIITLAFYLYATCVHIATRKRNFLLSIIYILFATYIYLINSRMGLLNYGFMTAILLWYFVRNWLGIRKTLFLAIPFLMLMTTALILHPKFEVIFNRSDSGSSPLSRELLWKSALQVIAEKPFLGYGLGGGEEALCTRSELNGVDDALERKLNAHNQFLQSILDNGLLGIGLFLLSLFFLIRQKKETSTYFYLLLLIAFAFLTESMLQRISGVVILGSMIYLIGLPSNRKAPESCANYSNLLLLVSITALLAIFSAQLLIAYDQQLLITSHEAESYAVDDFELLAVQVLPSPLPAQLQGKEFSAVKYDSTVHGKSGAHGMYRPITLDYLEVNDGDFLSLSVFCFVSEDFDGTWSGLSVTGCNNGKRQEFYNLKEKSKWQLLEINTVCVNDKISLGLSFSKYHSDSFNDMHGYVIFALPQYKLIRDGVVVKQSQSRQE